ncbi:hypothetical protein [Dictyobacter formicarum]|uniref:Flagellar FliJ protein n=1 Tax=Dictyobacter formicarum TaxID=2778368 RepID=A0ABQ3VQT2_9CHLR|nr:hypothetical protein [Dictyobacter formicarum]GHO88222.1 hypothetical protein KSZ_62280 [Dictyobacter formicarum]
MAFSEKTTYAFRIQTQKNQIQSLKERIEADESFVLDIKRPASLFASLISSSLRATNIHQVSQARSRIATLQMQLAQAEAELQELTRLQAKFPEHDRLVEQANSVGFQSWKISIQEQELDAYDRSVLVKQRLEDKRMLEEEESLLEELAEIECRQKELEEKKAKLASRMK